MKNFGLAWLAAMLQTSMASIIMVNPDQSRIVELSETHPNCKLHTKTSDVEKMLEDVDPNFVHPMDENALFERMTACQNLKGPAQMFIYPGTKWCGPGNTAKNPHELGKYEAEDRCCRDHDLCPGPILRGHCLDGICNHSPFTKSSCKCDEAFKRCLRELNTPTANTLGTIFFNVAQVMCYTRNCSESGECRTTLSTVSHYPNNLSKKKITVNYLTNIFQEFVKGLFKHKPHYGKYEEFS